MAQASDWIRDYCKKSKIMYNSHEFLEENYL